MVRRGAVSGAGALSRDGVAWVGRLRLRARRLRLGARRLRLGARRLRHGIGAPRPSALRAFSTLAGNAKLRALAGARG
jgi:hypothetical protein